MFTPFSLFFAFLFSTSTLPNGIRLTELPATGDVVEITAGFQTVGSVSERSSIHAMKLVAYSAGGSLDVFAEAERTGFRMRIPNWAIPMLTEPMVEFFQDASATEAPPDQEPPDFREQVEEEIRDALLGLRSQLPHFGTDRAFLSMSAPIPADLQSLLAAIPKRLSNAPTDIPTSRLPAERTLRFKADLPSGAVIFAAPVSGAYYEGWYSVLTLDRLARRVIQLKASTALKLSVQPYYYRLEVPVPAGQFAEDVEEALMQELQRLQFSRARPEDLEAARRDAIAYLETSEVKEWFATQGIAERRTEGVQRIQKFSADDMRTTARDLLVNRVIASWSPKAQRTTAQVENLAVSSPVGPSAARQPSPAGRGLRSGGARGEGTVTPAFPPHTDPQWTFTAPERLPSGVDIIGSTVHGVFVSGATLTVFDREPDSSVLAKFQTFRADRILVLTPPDSLPRVRLLWSNFSGNATDKVFTVPLGRIATGDLAALYLLKTLIDRRLIEAGLWGEASTVLEANTGSTLVIQPEAHRSLIISWIKDYAATAPSASELQWARETTIHHLPVMLPHLQSITWQRDPLGIIQNLETVTATHLQDVARIYFN